MTSNKSLKLGICIGFIMKHIVIALTILVIAFGMYSITLPDASAHRSGCHRWHSCPSDTGSYTCGDTGYCSECTDNNYCKAGQPISLSSTQSTSNPTKPFSPPNTLVLPQKQKTIVQSTPVNPACDTTLWNHVYHQQRLKIIDSCKTVTGIIQSIKNEADGDYHIQLKLDAKFSNLINFANVMYQHGYLVLEPVCQSTVTQSDAKSACMNFKSTLTIPPKGSHVTVTGTYVLDLQHDSWAEIHPISHIAITN